ncbi:MAG: aldo/keto reductase [Candidatus Binatia bacterium]|nr:aldo/keto reductase [Candidatus Binatia bacterium]
MRTRTIILSAIAISGLVGLTVSGSLLYDSLIGLDSSHFPAGDALQSVATSVSPKIDKAAGGLILALALVLTMAIATFFVVRGTIRAQNRENEGVEGERSDRRWFLASSATAATALIAGGTGMLGRALFGLGTGKPGWNRPVTEVFGGDVVKTHPVWEDEWKGSRVAAYGRLGRTEWPVSDTVLGTGSLRGESGTKIVQLALERGINYIDTAPDYAGAGSEAAVGRALQGVPRDSVFLATKFCTPIGHLPAGSPVERYKEVIDESLGRLGTDYVDLVHVHSCDEVDRLMDPNMHTAFEQLRDEGKARFLGFSSHTPRLPEVATTAIESGKFDVMMVAYHHGIWSELGTLIEKARNEQDMGVVAMKTLKGAKHHGLEGFRDDASSYAQSALKWVHSNPNVSCAVISFSDMQHVDEYLYASGKKAGGTDVARLERYDQQILGSYCTPHCGDCLDSCPEELAINDILRHRMYFEDYRAERVGLEAYAKLDKNASLCATCPAPCLGSCPVGIPIKERLQGAHDLLTLV